MTDRTHYVYEAYDADGLLLYVGCTANPEKRFRDHMRGCNDGRGWFDAFVTNWSVSGPYPRALAFAIERERINQRDPIWNGDAPGNRAPRHRQSINEYLAYHGVCFEPHPGGRNRPILVPAKKKRNRRSLRVVS